MYEDRESISPNHKPWSGTSSPFRRARAAIAAVPKVGLKPEMPVEVVGQGAANPFRHPWKLERHGIVRIADQWHGAARIRVLIPRKYIPLRVGITLSECRRGNYYHCDHG